MSEALIYLLLLLIGGIGFLAMFLLGFAHFGGGHGDGGHGVGGDHVGGHHVGGHHAGGAHGHGGHGVGGHHVGGADGHGDFHGPHGAMHGFKLVAKSWLSFSPMDFFGACLGGGAAGLLFQRSVSETVLPFVAVAGAIIICFFVMKPLTGLLAKFVSTPSEGLEGMVAKSAEAVSNFDKKGQGLVRVHLDGQVVQLLGILDPAEVEVGITVKTGDSLTVVEVDPRRNICKVSRELSA